MKMKHVCINISEYGGYRNVFVLHKIYDCLYTEKKYFSIYNNKLLPNYVFICECESDKHIATLYREVFEKMFVELSEYRKGKIDAIIE